MYQQAESVKMKIANWNQTIVFFFFSFLLFFPHSSALTGRGFSKSVDVGVILDTKSWIGNMSWSCMLMALEDFYEAHPSYTTKLTLHLRDTDKTSTLGAADAALDLLENVQVQAIIGPQTSAQAKFIIELGGKTRVPIITFSAKSPRLSPQKSPYFVRAAMNDSPQTQAIASLVQAFQWREVVPIFEDGLNGIVRDLIDALEAVGARVPYRSRLPLSANKSRIEEELEHLKSKRTRVFVVHMSYDSGLRLFSRAKEAGMMGEGYVWITTYGLTDLVDLDGSSAAQVMQGVLGVKPYVRETKKLDDFRSRWRKRFQYGTGDQVYEPTVFGLWAYDAVWALALAVENASKHDLSSTNSTTARNYSLPPTSDLAALAPSPTGEIILGSILSTRFEGLAGEFRLINGELESGAFEITNVVGHGRRSVGYWTPGGAISGDLDDRNNKNNNKELKAIMWPGGKVAPVPKGWEWPISGKNLTIGLPVKPGFEEFVRKENGKPKGYCIEVFDAVMKEMPFHVSYEYKFYEDSSGHMNGTYDDLVYQVYLQKFDAVVGDITILANRSLYVDFTLPYTESGIAMLVPVIDKSHKNAWTFLKPLTPGLWLASGAFFIFTGFVVWVLEHRVNEEFRGTPSNQLGRVFYFSFSTLVFAHREKIVSNWSRIVVIIWVFAVLILQSSYTASLTSMLTMEHLQPTVTDINELAKDGSFVGYLNDSFMPSFLKRLNFNESKLIAYQSPEEYHEALSNGTVAAIVDEIPYIKVFLSKFCKKKYITIGPTYKTDGFGFAFPKYSPLVPDVSRAILKLTEGDKMATLEQELYGDGSCSDQGNESTTSRSLTIKSFSGLFGITGISSVSALSLCMALFLRKHLHILKSDDTAKTVWQKLALLAKAYDKMDSAEKPEENKIPAMGNLISGSQSPDFSISSYASKRFELEEVGTPPNGEEEVSPGMEISRESHDPPSFADMILTERE